MISLKPAVYALCAMTSLFCAILLARGYRRNRSGLLLYTALCFAGLALNNVVVYIDLVVLPETDLTVLRHAIALISVAVLIYGFVWELD
jgi:hypothetical protein